MESEEKQENIEVGRKVAGALSAVNHKWLYQGWDIEEEQHSEEKQNSEGG